MRRVLLMVAIVCTALGASAAAPGPSPREAELPATTCSSPLEFPKCEATRAKSTALVQEARRGCCSHHGGVCGCDSQSHHQLCCDGELSPSCGC